MMPSFSICCASKCAARRIASPCVASTRAITFVACCQKYSRRNCGWSAICLYHLCSRLCYCGIFAQEKQGHRVLRVSHLPVHPPLTILFACYLCYVIQSSM